MSTTVDNRVVQMTFDNERFEKNVGTSLGTLEKLNKGLDMTSAASKLSQLGDAAKNVSFAALANGVETVSLKFSALQVAAFTALQDIVRSAENAGKRIISALTIDPIKTGFQEYETQINAVQTILANTSGAGKTLDDVSGALDELNHYADKTIYNFTEMTRNIGTFTAAGVDLDTSVAAIKGIANLAAVSGSTSQQASTAMYQLSQALAAGTVNLQDWNSVVNAGMGGKVFQDALKETARLMGKNIDETQSFRESISGQGGTGWLDGEVLLETLKKFTGDLTEADLLAKGYTKEQAENILKMGVTANEAATKVKTFTQLFDTLKESAQSGWTSSWETIIGDFEEAKVTLTQLSDVIGAQISASADARNKILTEWKELGGREDIVDSFWNIFHAISSVKTVLGQAMEAIFPKATGKDLKAITASLESFTHNLMPLPSTLNKLRTTFKGFFAILDIGKQAITAVWNAITPLFGGVNTLTGDVLSVTAAWGEWLVKLDEAIRESGIFSTVIQSVVNFLSGAFTKVHDIVKAIVSSDIFGSILDRVGARFEQISEFMTLMGTNIGAAFDQVGQAIKTSGLAKGLSMLWSLVQSISAKVSNAISSMLENINNAFGNINYAGVFDIASGTGIGAIAFAIKKFIDNLADAVNTEDGEGIIGKITGIFDALSETLGAFQAKLKADALMGIAKAVAVLAGAVAVLSLIDSVKLASALSGLAVMFAELGTTMVFIENANIGGKSLTSAAAGMTVIATAALILAGAVKKMSGIDFLDMGKGLLGVGVLLTEISLFMKTAKFDKGAGKHALGIMIIAGAVNILANAVSKFKDLDIGQIAKGLGAVGTLLLEVAAFTKLTGNAKHVISSGVALVAIAGAMTIFSKAVDEFGKIPLDNLKVGLVGIAGALTFVAIAMNSLPKGMASKGAGMVAVAGSLAILAKVVDMFGNMNLDGMVQGFVGLGGAMLILSTGLNAMTGTLGGATSLAIATVAIMGLVPAIAAMAAIPVKGLIKSLVTLATSFAIIGAAGALLTPMVPTILALSASLLSIAGVALGIGAGLALVGVGLAAIATGFTAIATAGAAGATAFVASITVIINGILGLIPTITAGIVQGIITFTSTLAQAAPKIASSMLTLMQTIIDIVVQGSSMVVEGFLTLLNNILQSIAEHGPSIVQAFFDILVGILNVIAENIDDVVEAGVSIVVAIIEGISSKLPDIIQAGFDLLLAFIHGVTDAINNNTEALTNAMIDLILAVINAGLSIITTSIGRFIQAGRDIMDSGLIQGIVDKAKNFTKEVWDAVRSAKDKVVDKLSDWVEVGSNIIGGMVQGIKDGAYSIIRAARDAASNALDSAKNFLGINSPSKAFMEVGRYSDEGFANGIAKFAGMVSDAAKGVGKNAIDNVSTSMDRANDVVSRRLNLNPTVKPVMDISNIEHGANRAKELMQNLEGNMAVKSVKMADRASVSINRHNFERNRAAMDIQASSKSANGVTEVTIHNHFSITSNNADEVVSKVSRALQHDVDRRYAVWGSKVQRA